jgi:broad specificity phosphatase PhoE
MNAKEILEAVRALSPEERAQVRALLDTPPDAPLSPEEEAQARLLAAGLLGETAPRPATGWTRHTPVEIKGKPLSWTIANERR